MATRMSFLTLLCASLILSNFSISILAQNDLFCNSKDKVILLQIKSHFNGAGLLSDWDPNTDCCTDWPFIGCTSESNPNPGRVTAVTISGGTGLSGTLPDVLGNLPYLAVIQFFDEKNLTGPIPQSYSKLTNLQLVTLNSNSLSGHIPAFLGKLKKLSKVDLSDNLFTGNIPTSLGALPALTEFNVSSNQLCGAIPSGLAKFGASAFQPNKCLCGAPLRACK